LRHPTIEQAESRQPAAPAGSSAARRGLLVAAKVVVSAGLLARGLGLPLGFADSLALVPAIMLITFFPLSVAGWGVREGAAIVLLGTAGIATDGALAVSVLFGLGLLIAGLPGLVIWLVAGRAGRPRPASSVEGPAPHL